MAQDFVFCQWGKGFAERLEVGGAAPWPCGQHSCSDPAAASSVFQGPPLKAALPCSLITSLSRAEEVLPLAEESAT